MFTAGYYVKVYTTLPMTLEQLRSEKKHWIDTLAKNRNIIDSDTIRKINCRTRALDKIIKNRLKANDNK